MDNIVRKATGSYYTCNSVADYIARWVIDTPDTCVLEPSFGDGIFIDSARSRFAELGNSNPNIIGIEIQKEPYDLYMGNHDDIVGFQMDFMDYQLGAKIDAIIGNPPYVSLKKLNKEEKEKALYLAHSYGVNMQSSGSLWMPFIIHSTELLETRGKLGFVLPYEITHVRYAFDLWKYLSNNFGRITLCRIYKDFFPKVDVETIIFLAEEKGKTTDRVYYKVFDTLDDLYVDNAFHISQILISDIINLKKPFESELIPEAVSNILQSLRKCKKMTDLINECKFKIGYVSGNKKFFHPSSRTISQFSINSKNLKRCLLNAKKINSNANIGIETALISTYDYLFYPTQIEEGERQYIESGMTQSVHKAYKCKVRNPWYLVPGIEIPDMVLTVFGDTPRLMLNNGEFYITNSLLSGFAVKNNCKELICRWYNSLTLLSIETKIHSLGGGTLVFIPGETDKLEIISDFPDEQTEIIYEKIAGFAKNHSTEEIYKYGDTIVLKEIYGISDEEIIEIRKAISILRNWRNPEKRRG